MIEQARYSNYFSSLIGVTPLTEEDLKQLSEEKDKKREYDKLVKESRDLRDSLGVTRWHRVKNTVKKPFVKRDAEEMENIESTAAADSLMEPVSESKEEIPDGGVTNRISSIHYQSKETLPLYTPYFKIGPFKNGPILKEKVEARDQDISLVVETPREIKLRKLKDKIDRINELSQSQAVTSMGENARSQGYHKFNIMK